MSDQVKLSRKLLNDPLWLSEPFTRGQAWVDLFAMAKNEDCEVLVHGKKVDLKRGQFSCSENDLSERWKWSRGKVRRFLDELKTVQRIVQPKNSPITTITICNYDKYQGNEIVDKFQTVQDTVQDTVQPPFDAYIDPAHAPARPRARLGNNINTISKNNISKKGSRLEIEKLPPQWEYFCKHERPDLIPLKVFEQFHDYWVAAPGQKGVKADWFATWRNWVRNSNSVTTGKKLEKSESVPYHKRMENYKV